MQSLRDPPVAVEHDVETPSDNRLRMMGQLAAGISHELAQPLLAAHNFAFVAASLCEKMDDPPARLVSSINGVLGQIDRAMKIMRHLQDFISRGEPTKTKFDLNEAVHDAVAPLRQQLSEANITISCSFKSALRPVWADNVLIQQVVVNLLRNAAEAIAGCDGELRNIEVETGLESAGMAYVSISNTGPGLPSDFVQLFEPFHSTKPGSLGVGLSLSQAIIEQCGGRLWANNRKEGGATFTFTLPLARGETQ